MAAESRHPKDEWWHIIVKVREEEKKRRAEEEILKAVQKQIGEYDDFTQIAAHLVGDAALGKHRNLEDCSNTSTWFNRMWNLKSESSDNAERVQTKDKTSQIEAEEAVKAPSKKRNKAKAKNKTNAKRTARAATTGNDLGEGGESHPGEPSPGEGSSSQASPFTFDFQRKSSREISQEDSEVHGSNNPSLTVGADQVSEKKSKSHTKGAKSMSLAEAHKAPVTDVNRDAAVDRLKREPLPMSLEEARGKRNTIRKHRSDSIQFLRERTFSRGSSVSGSRPPSPPQRDLALKVDHVSLEDVEEAPDTPGVGFDKPTADNLASVGTVSGGDSAWQTVSNHKHKKQQKLPTGKTKHGKARLKRSTNNRPTAIRLSASEVHTTDLHPKESSTTLVSAARTPVLGLEVAPTQTTAVSPSLEFKVPEHITSDGHEGSLQDWEYKTSEIGTANKSSVSSPGENFEDQEIGSAVGPADDLSIKGETLEQFEHLDEFTQATNAWKDQSDEETENTPDRQRVPRDPLPHSENNEAYVFHDRPFLVPPQLSSEDNVRNGTCFPHLKIFLGNPDTGQIPDQVRRDPATPPLICKCARFTGNHAVVEYDARIHRMVIHPMPNPRPDHRNNPYHPDYLPPFKQAEYQAYEQAGYPVYRFDRVTFECNLSTCRKDLKDHVRTTILCNGCGPYSDVRYCSKEHLFEDCKDHWQICGLTPPRIVWDDWTMPTRYRRRYPAIRDVRGRTTPERQRQQAYSIHHKGSDYVIFNDWKDKQDTGEECRATGKPILYLIFKDDDPMKDRFNRLLNIAFFGESFS